MGKYGKRLDKLLRGTSDASIDFDDLRRSLKRLGLEHIRGSHHLCRREGIEEKINLQRSKRHAKPYQVPAGAGSYPEVPMSREILMHYDALL